MQQPINITKRLLNAKDEKNKLNQTEQHTIDIFHEGGKKNGETNTR
jgi:hypothetical protein